VYILYIMLYVCIRKCTCSIWYVYILKCVYILYRMHSLAKTWAARWEIYWGVYVNNIYVIYCMCQCLSMHVLCTVHSRAYTRAPHGHVWWRIIMNVLYDMCKCWSIQTFKYVYIIHNAFSCADSSSLLTYVMMCII